MQIEMNRHMRRRMAKGRRYRAPDELHGIESFGGGGSNGVPGYFTGDSQPQQNQPQQAPQQNPQQPNNYPPLFGQEEQQNTELDSVLEAFAVADSQGQQQAAAPEMPAERIQQMQANVRSAIQSMQMPQDLIPADFDPQNPQQMQVLLNRAMQHTITQALNVVFQPVQLAMEAQAANMEHLVDKRIKDSQSSAREQTVLEQMVPEINNDKYRGLVTQLDNTLKASGKPAKDRATAIRKVLNSMGINDSGSSQGGSNRRSANPTGQQGGMSTGKAALDKFFPSFG